MSAELATDTISQEEDQGPFDQQMAELFEVIEKLEDTIAAAGKREKNWSKEKKQLLEAQTKLEKKIQDADEDIKYIKEHLDQAKKDKEQTQSGSKKERDRIVAAAKQEQETLMAEIKQLKAKNKKLQQNMEKVTNKLDSAIVKIGELMEA